MRILLTGTPGTGKTSVGLALAKHLKLGFTEVNELVKQKKLFSKKEGDALVVKMPALKKALAKTQGVIDGHVLCDLKMKADFVFVLRCDPETLVTRMRKRKYGPQKIADNTMAEVLDYCTLHALKNYPKKRVFEVDTSKKTTKQTVNAIARVIKNKKLGKLGIVDWTYWL